VQESRDLLLIPIAIELSLHSEGRHCHLAERQCRRENFDEKRFHPSPGFKLGRLLSSFLRNKGSGAPEIRAACGAVMPPVADFDRFA